MALAHSRPTNSGDTEIVPKRAFRSVLAGFLFVALGAVAPRPIDAEPLKIIYSDWPGWVAWEIALEKKWDKEAGLDLEFMWMDYVAGMDAFAAGQVDGVLDDERRRARHRREVRQAVHRDPDQRLLERQRHGDRRARASRSSQDLKGKKMGVEVGFVSHLLLLKALESAGMKRVATSRS